MNFREIKANDDTWFEQRGFTKQPDGSYAKAKRSVPHLRPAPVAVAEPDPRHAPVHAPQREAIYSGRVSVCITSFCCGTQRDTDNIFVKYALDCCRYAGLISSDCPGAIDLVVKETRVPSKAEEGFEILITPI